MTVATGGTITYVGGYTIHTFTEDGFFTVSEGGDNIEVLLVGAGGAGGNMTGGGGGAGGVIHTGAYTVEDSTAYEVIVGVGVSNASGEDTTFDSLTAVGGGRGGANAQNGSPGGSGGGSGHNNKTGGAGTAGQGFAGESCNHQGPNYGAGGGGGASEAGGTDIPASTVQGGSGGDGLQFDISGVNTFYAGGGGGGTYNGGTLGIGGDGGGGDAPAVAGADGLGGGGGGQRNNGGLGGIGGSGIAIFSYLTPTPSKQMRYPRRTRNLGLVSAVDVVGSGDLG